MTEYVLILEPHCIGPFADEATANEYASKHRLYANARKLMANVRKLMPPIEDTPIELDKWADNGGAIND